MLKRMDFFLLLGLGMGPAGAQEAHLGEDDAAARAAAAAEFEASLDFKQGMVTLPNGVATLEVPEGFRYAGPDDARRVLEQGWGNPDGHGTLGMLFPVDIGVVSEGSWGVVISYEEDGHVSDADADAIDYDAMLAGMRSAIAQENEARERAGYEPLQIVGWAAKPRYDKAAKKLYWATGKDLTKIGIGTTTDLHVAVPRAERCTIEVGIGNIPKLEKEGLRRLCLIAGTDPKDDRAEAGSCGT